MMAQAKLIVIIALFFIFGFFKVYSTSYPSVPLGEFSISEPPSNEDMVAVIETCGPVIPIQLSEVIKNTITLRPQTGIQVEDVFIQSGIVMENAGPFDFLTDLQFTRTNLRDPIIIGIPSNLEGTISRGILKESKKFRTGTLIDLSFEAATYRDPRNILNPNYSDATINFKVQQPVLREFLYGKDTITELASKYELKAVYYSSLFNISDLIRQSLIAYWNVLRSQQLIKVFKESVKSFEELAYKVQRLIDEDQLARSEINQPLAQLASEKINLMQAKQNLYTDVQNLKFSMGIINTHCFSDPLLFAITPFPEVNEELDVCRMMEALTCYALKHRLDNRASEMRIEEYAVLVKGAENQKLPQLDFFYEFTLNQQKRDDRYFFSSYSFYHPERDNAIGIVFSYPLGNHYARGLYRQMKAEWNRQIMSTQELSQKIVSEVMDAWMSHIRLQLELKDATDAVDSFQHLVTDENKRLKAGFGNLFNLVDYQTRLTQAKSREIEIKRNIGENLANLHFYTGSLLRKGSNLCAISVEDVANIPDVGCGK